MKRRDFIQGSALTFAAGSTLTPAELLANPSATNATYPPGLMGMRGSHPGSFETAHALSWSGQKWPKPKQQTDDTYDLVVVGGGLSGLAAAYFYRQRVGAEARILVLDNHDDFGGHAKRNEFTVDGHTLIGYGGSQSIDTPGSYSRVAANLLKELSIDTDQFYTYFDAEFNKRHNLTDGIRFAAADFGETKALPNFFSWFESWPAAEVNRRIDQFPVSPATRTSLKRLAAGQLDPSKEVLAMAANAKQTSTNTFLKAAYGMTDEGLFLLNRVSGPLWGMSLDSLSIMESIGAYMLGEPAANALFEIIPWADDYVEPKDESEPYIFHFPDGNATIARLLVRSLIPGSIPGRTMEDAVTATADYSKLDLRENNVRIRLNSTAVNVENRDGGVDVTYVQNGKTVRVRSLHCTLACYNNIIPHLAPEIDEPQRQALQYPQKVPLLLINVALRNWQAIADSGIGGFYAPSGVLCNMAMDFPVSLGNYIFTNSPNTPAVLQGWGAPGCGQPGSAKEQLNLGRHEIFNTSFDTYEQRILEELNDVWGASGLDVERDVAGLTINRWPHGYAYEYMDLWDSAKYSRGAGPHVIGRQQIGNITIANSDSEAYAYVNAAIDAAHRAVRELTT